MYSHIVYIYVLCISLHSLSTSLPVRIFRGPQPVLVQDVPEVSVPLPDPNQRRASRKIFSTLLPGVTAVIQQMGD